MQAENEENLVIHNLVSAAFIADMAILWPQKIIKIPNCELGNLVEVITVHFLMRKYYIFRIPIFEESATT